MGLCGSKKDPGVVDTGDVTLRAVDGKPLPRAAQEEEAKKEAAAVKMQAASRGKQGRKVVPPLKQAPCNKYRINMQAENFGDCMCGWPKGEHAASAFNTEGVTRAKRVDSTELRGKMLTKEKVACSQYRVNMEAENFGDCMCGRPKAEHTDVALTPTGPQQTKAVDEKELRAKFVQKEKAGCPRYRVNMQSANFGECMCGRPKAEHTDEALKGEKEEKKQVDEDELRRKMTAKEKADCTEFNLNMAPGAPFAQCICGRLKKDHSDAALASEASANRTRKDSEVREKMIKKETVSCTRYRLDMDPSAPFGQCECGFPKALHSAAALSGKAPPGPPKPPPEVELPKSPEAVNGNGEATGGE